MFLIVLFFREDATRGKRLAAALRETVVLTLPSDKMLETSARRVKETLIY